MQLSEPWYANHYRDVRSQNVKLGKNSYFDTRGNVEDAVLFVISGSYFDARKQLLLRTCDVFCKDALPVSVPSAFFSILDAKYVSSNKTVSRVSFDWHRETFCISQSLDL